jgi:hypothetical protein
MRSRCQLNVGSHNLNHRRKMFGIIASQKGFNVSFHLSNDSLNDTQLPMILRWTRGEIDSSGHAKLLQVIASKGTFRIQSDSARISMMLNPNAFNCIDHLKSVHGHSETDLLRRT